MLFYSPFWGNDGRWLAWKIQVSYDKHSKGSISIISLIYSLLFCAASLPILCIIFYSKSIALRAVTIDHSRKYQKNTTYHNAFCLSPNYCISIVFSFSWGHFNSQEKLKTKLMQHFGVTNKEHYGMLWYFWSGQLIGLKVSQTN